MITKEELAKRLNGREIGYEISKEEHQEAAQAGLVVVFGYSDDGCEFRGAIHDEVGAYDYTEIRFTKDGKFYPDDMDKHAEFMEKHGMLDAFNAKFCNMIAASYAPWKYETDIPHTTFDVMEGGEVFGHGIVFHMDDLK
jgi:hypothetical protein